MSLELRENSRSFYARITINKERRVYALSTKYEGTPPVGLKMKQEGDFAFEKSRRAALEEEKELRQSLQKKVHKVKTLKKIHKIQTGEIIDSLQFKDLVGLHKNAVRKKEITTKHLENIELSLRRFVAFLKASYPKVSDPNGVTREMAEAFIQHEIGLGAFVNKTINEHKSHLSGLFETAESLERIYKNPFRQISDLGEDPEHRRPFTVDQLCSILEVSKEDPLIYPLVVTAMTTSMRLGDCCCLKWSSVREDIQQVMVPAARKTMKPMYIPYYGLQDAVFQEAKRSRGDSEYVFPKACKYYLGGMADMIHDRFERILLMAGFTDNEDPETSIRISRPNGGRKASLRGFHSFKTTWVTFAIMNGIPIEVIKKITGNQIVDVVLTNYFQPELEDIRKLVRSKMPGVIIGGESTLQIQDSRLNRTQCYQLVETMDEGNWKERKVELLRMLG